LEDLRTSIGEFIAERDWEQFHSPKNLAMALSVEVAEVVEHFQWLTEEQSQNLPPEKLADIREEIGDVMIYLIELADKLGLSAAVYDLHTVAAGLYALPATVAVVIALVIGLWKATTRY
jgi:dCTP diphosphatase